MGIKDKIENHPLVFFLGALIVGFLAGITAYQSIVSIANMHVISNTEYEKMHNISVQQDKKQELYLVTENQIDEIIASAQKIYSDCKDQTTNENSIVLDTISWFEETKVKLSAIGLNTKDSLDINFINEIQLRDKKTTSFRNPENRKDCVELLNSAIGHLRGLAFNYEIRKEIP